MSGDLKILSMASALARYAARRHEVIAQNIANADTGGYKAKDLEPFSEAYRRSLASVDSANSQISGGNKWRVIISNASGSESPNGNTVSLEDQMVRSVEAQQAHEAATAIYKKTIDILRLSLGRGN